MNLKLIYSAKKTPEDFDKAYIRAIKYREELRGRKPTVKEKQQLRKDIKRVYSSDIERI